MSTRRFKPGFIGEETDYTRGNVVPGAAPVLAKEGDAIEVAPNTPIPDETRPIAPKPVTGKARTVPPAPAEKKARPAIAQEAGPVICRCIVRFALDADTTRRLDAVAQDVGQDASVILAQLRKSVVSRLHEVLAGGQRPSDRALGTAVEGGGAKVRINFTLTGEEYARARAWFDPLGIGDHAMRENMIPALARLYRERIRDLGKA